MPRRPPGEHAPLRPGLGGAPGDPGPARGAPVHPRHRRVRGPVARGARDRRRRGRRGRARLPVPAQAAARRLRRPEPGPDRCACRGRGRGPLAGRRGRPAAAARGGDRLRGGAVGDPRPRPRRADAARSRRRATSTTPGSSSESVAPGADRPAPAFDAAEIAERLARSLDLVGLLTVELFQLRGGGLMINELAPRVHNSGHWSIEGAATSQFEQQAARDPRAAAGLGGAARRRRDGQPAGHGRRTATRASAGSRMRARDPGVHLHVYGKRRVFERRKMGHVTVVGTDADEALERARRRARGAALGGLTRRDGGRRGGTGRGHRGRQPLGLPGAREGAGGPRRAGRPVRAAGRVSAHRTPDHLFRYAETAARARDPGDHRRGRAARPTCPGCSPRRRPCRSSASRSRPSTWAAWTRCSRSSRCRAGSRSRRSPSATPTTRRCWRRQILALGDDGARGAAGGLAGRRRPTRSSSDESNAEPLA